MLHSRHIVVADFPGGKTATVYQGADWVSAQEAMAAEVAKGEAEAVCLFSHPLPTTVRYPLQDKAAAAARAEEAEAAKEAEARKAALELEAKKAEVKRLQAEIRKLS
jgi:hypothetical protein